MRTLFAAWCQHQTSHLTPEVATDNIGGLDTLPSLHKDNSEKACVIGYEWMYSVDAWLDCGVKSLPQSILCLLDLWLVIRTVAQVYPHVVWRQLIWRRKLHDNVVGDIFHIRLWWYNYCLYRSLTRPGFFDQLHWLGNSSCILCIKTSFLTWHHVLVLLSRYQRLVEELPLCY